MQIVELSTRRDLLTKAISYFWNCWGNDSNFAFYCNCIENSLNPGKPLPKFYIALENNTIIGSYALVVNDLISRQDLMPWFACLFVNTDCRNKGIAKELLQHGLWEARTKGFNDLYLSTDLDGFYEQTGWKHICNGYNVHGEELKIYSKPTI